MDIKPIETVYKGYRFRSRTEARWAVFFDALELEWEYEREGYDLPSGKYLPDFWLPKQMLWGEVKPRDFSGIEEELIVELSQATGFPVIYLSGIPDNKAFQVFGNVQNISSPPFLLRQYRDGRSIYTWSDDQETITQKVYKAIRKSHSARFEYDERETI